MLRLPGVARTDALWLKDKEGDIDLVIPIASASSEIQAGKLYSEEEFLNAMRSEANKETFDNSPRMKDSPR
jgi:hypothetical protein